jgi:hypothetical protein
MNATAVERITPPKTEPSHHVRQVLPPFIGVLVKWGLFALVGIGIRPFGCSGPCSKVALDAATRLRRHILDPSLGQVGNLRRHLDHFSLFLWLNLRFAAKNIDLVDGDSFFNKSLHTPR